MKKIASFCVKLIVLPVLYTMYGFILLISSIFFTGTDKFNLKVVISKTTFFLIKFILSPILYLVFSIVMMLSFVFVYWGYKKRWQPNELNAA